VVSELLLSYSSVYSSSDSSRVACWWCWALTKALTRREMASSDKLQLCSWCLYLGWGALGISHHPVVHKLATGAVLPPLCWELLVTGVASLCRLIALLPLLLLWLLTGGGCVWRWVGLWWRVSPPFSSSMAITRLLPCYILACSNLFRLGFWHLVGNFIVPCWPLA